MTLGRSIHCVTIAFVAALWLAACSSATMVSGDLGIDDAPDWVNRGSQALKNGDGRLIRGIGSAASMDNLSLQVSVADERARAEVARVLSSFMRVASHDYAAVTDMDTEQSASESAVSRRIESTTQQNVSGARIIAHWRNPENGRVWSLAELDLQQVKSAVAASQRMNAGFRDYFVGHADNVFDGMVEGAAQ